MPVATQIDTTVNGLKKGDTFVWTNTEYTVDSVNKKTTWGYISVLEQPSPIRAKLTDTLTITRMVPTAAEEEEQKRAYTERVLRERIATAPEIVAQARASFIKNIDVYDGFGASYYADFLMAQETGRLWAQVTERMEKTGEDLITAYTALIKYHTSRLIEEEFGPRSSSAAHNFAEAVIKNAKRKWVADAVWVAYM